MHFKFIVFFSMEFLKFYNSKLILYSLNLITGGPYFNSSMSKVLGLNTNACSKKCLVMSFFNAGLQVENFLEEVAITVDTYLILIRYFFFNVQLFAVGSVSG